MTGLGPFRQKASFLTGDVLGGMSITRVTVLATLSELNSSLLYWIVLGVVLVILPSWKVMSKLSIGMNSVSEKYDRALIGAITS